jgi:hypothetical protein
MHPGEHFDVALAGLDRGQKGIGIDAGKTEETPVQGTGVDVFADFAGGQGPRLVEQPREMNVAAEAEPGAARRMSGKVGRGIGDHSSW